MSYRSSTSPVITSGERWLRWQRRGRDQDARLMRHAKEAFGTVFVAIVVAAFLLGR